jgi:hypothetical protein
MALDGRGTGVELEGGDDIEVAMSERNDGPVLERWRQEERWVVKISLR